MATLTGNTIASTYKDLLQVSNSNSGVDATLRAISDGEGTSSVMYLSSAAAQMTSDSKLYFRDTGLYIASNADGDLDIVSDGTAIDSMNIESAGGITLDAGSSTHGIIYEDDGTTMLQITNSSSDVVIKPLVDAKDIVFQQYDGTEVARIEDDTYMSIAVGLRADSQDGAAIGTSSYQFSDLYLADGAVIYLGDDSDVSLTHYADNGVLVNSTRKIYFEDGSNYDQYIGSAGSGVTAIAAPTEIDLTATTIDINGNVDVSGTLTVGGALDFSDAAITNVDTLQLDSIAGDGDTNTSITFSGSDVITVTTGGETQVTFNNGSILPTTDNDVDLGSSSYEYKDGYFDGTVYADAINFNGTAIASTAAELNIVDGDTSATGTTLADADRVVVNDNGTMVQVALTAFETYMESSLDTLSNVTTVGTLGSGAISSGFGAIDIGSSALSTTGSVTLGATTFGDNDITNVGSVQLDSIAGDGDTNTSITFSGSDVITVTAGGDTQFTFNNGSILPTTDNDIDLGSSSYEFKDGYFDGTVYADAINFNGTAIASTAAELNIVDGGTSATSTTLADADRVVVNDNGTMVQVALTDFETYMETSLDTLSSVTTVGTLASGAISSGFGAIDIGSSALSTTGSVTLGATTFGDNDITNVGDIALDSISADGTDINIAVDDNSATALTIKQGSDAYLIVDTANSSESVSLGTGISGTVVTIGHTTSETTVADNLTVTGDATVSGNLLVVGDSSEVKADNLVVDNPTIAMGLTNGSAPSADSGFDLGLKPHWHTGSGAKTAFLGVDVSTSASAPKLTYIPDASFSSDVVSGTAGTIVADVEGDVTGDLTGDVTGNTSGTAATVTTAAQTNITSLGTLTALTVDDVAVNGKVITMTGSSSDTAVFTAGTNGTLSIVTTDAAAAAANIQITADGTAELAGTTVTLDSAGGVTIDADSGTITFSDAGSSLGTITSSGYSGTAAIATAVTITDNESTDEDNAVIFTAGGDVDGGNLGLESDGNLTYNPSTGRLTATQLAGTLQTAAQTNITSVGTIATGTWEATDVAVAHGGTGASTLTANGALIGNGTSAITSVDMGTKGDILIGDGSGNPSVLDVGTNDYILTAASGETTGVKWAELAAASKGFAVAMAVAL